MAHTTSEIERSISLEESSGYDSTENEFSHDEIWLPLESDVSRLKAENTNRLHQRWDEIIAKYSAIDDNKESDEIDLDTGLITVDNGHLSSIQEDKASSNNGSLPPSIWAVDDEFERETRRRKHAERLQKKAKREQRERMKAQSVFYNKNMLFLDTPSDSLEDNLSILSSSPTKKHKTASSSPIPSRLPSPSKGHGLALNTPQSSPLKQALNEELDSVVMSPNASLLESPTHKSRLNLAFPSVSKLSITKVRSLSHNQQDSDTSFSICELFDPIPFALFSCAFYSCKFSSASKASYRAHLLSVHSPELQQIGYPVKCETQTSQPILGDTIPKLNVHFPLVFSDLPGRPYICGSEIGSGRCQKVFIDEEALIRHKQQAPNSCSLKRQVYVCPLLGCDFMTDSSYDEFRTHIGLHGEDRENGTYRENREYRENGNESSKPLGVSTPEIHFVSEYFSDSLSSVCFPEEDSEMEQADSKHTVIEKACLKSGEKNSSTSTIFENEPPNKKFTPTTHNDLPKLDIVDCDSELEHTIDTNDRGYSSIDELFRD